LTESASTGSASTQSASSGPASTGWLPLAPRWPPLRPGRSLVWSLPEAYFDDVDAERTVDGLQLQRKREFHTTLLDGGSTARLQAALRTLPGAAATRWRREVLALDWRWRRSGELWLVARRGGGKPPAQSIIERIEQPAQAQLRERVGQLLGTPLPPPYPHVTLYTQGDAGGIGIPDPATLCARALRRL